MFMLSFVIDAPECLAIGPPLVTVLSRLLGLYFHTFYLFSYLNLAQPADKKERLLFLSGTQDYLILQPTGKNG